MHIYQIERDLLREHIKKFADYIKGNTLDVGGGAFKRYTDLFKKITKYTILDINPGLKPDIVGNADSMPVGDGSFDSIVCTQVLGDVPNPFRVVQEFSRVLRHGGVVLLTEGFINELHDMPLDFWRFTNFGLEEIFKKNGFEIVAVERIGGFFAVQAQMKIRYAIERLKLYRKPFWAGLLSPLFRLLGKLAKFLDKIDHSDINHRFALDWIIVANKIIIKK